MKSPRASKPKSDPPAVRLSPSDPADLQPKMQKVQLAIARRAHELFEARGGEHGHDLEDWFRAECELLCPVSVSMSESRDKISVRVSGIGFDETELEVSIEPHRITILGNKETSEMRCRGQNNRADRLVPPPNPGSRPPCNGGDAGARSRRIASWSAEI